MENGWIAELSTGVKNKESTVYWPIVLKGSKAITVREQGWDFTDRLSSEKEEV